MALELSLDSYNRVLDTLKFSPAFVNLGNRGEVTDPALIERTLGIAIFKDLQESGILKPFEGFVNSRVRRTIRQVIETVMERAKAARPEGFTFQEFMDDFFLPQSDLIALMLRTRLETAYELMLLARQMERAVADVSNAFQEAMIAQTRAAVQAAVEETEERVKREERVDALTGLGGRKAFNEHLAYLRENAADETFWMIIWDVDHFKNVNDTKGGHPIGDKVLVKLGELLQQHTREGTAFRLGGEEFVAVFQAEDSARPRELAETIRLALMDSEFESSTGEPFRVTISAGMASGGGFTLWESEETTPPGCRCLYLEADQALYMAKGKLPDGTVDPNGRNRTWISGLEDPEPRSR